jgi:histidinol phosphatase-like PHP family hydrolase
MGTNYTPEDFRITYTEADASVGENWADVNLEAFAAKCRAHGVDVTISTDADDYDETRDCGDLIHEGAIYRVYVEAYSVYATYV